MLHSHTYAFSFLYKFPSFNIAELNLYFWTIMIQGENIVLMSNHQSEADPAIIALLLESTHPYLAENMVNNND